MTRAAKGGSTARTVSAKKSTPSADTRQGGKGRRPSTHGAETTPIAGSTARSSAGSPAGARAVAAVASLPVPFLGFAMAAFAHRDRLARYHGLQGGTWTVLGLLALLIVGLVGRSLQGDAMEAVAGLVLAGTVLGALWGAWGAARGRYVRLRPAWDLLAAARSVAAASQGAAKRRPDTDEWTQAGGRGAP